MQLEQVCYGRQAYHRPACLRPHRCLQAVCMHVVLRWPPRATAAPCMHNFFLQLRRRPTAITGTDDALALRTPRRGGPGLAYPADRELDPADIRISGYPDIRTDIRRSWWSWGASTVAARGDAWAPVHHVGALKVNCRTGARPKIAGRLAGVASRSEHHGGQAGAR